MPVPALYTEYKTTEHARPPRQAGQHPQTSSTGSTARCSTPSATARWRPGTRLTQEDIAAQLAVSRQPVLQALRLLKKDGLVLDAPGRGVLVAPLDAGWIAKVYQVRGALDALAARLAAAAARRASIPTLIERGRRAARGRNVKAHDRSRHRLPRRHLRRLGQPADRRRAPHLHWRAPAPRRWARCCSRRRSARRCGTSTRRSPRPSPPATPTRAARLIERPRPRSASENLGRRLADVPRTPPSPAGDDR